MAQFFNHEQAENFRSDVMEHFPQLRVDGVLDIHDPTTNEYQRSFFTVSLWDGTDLLHTVYVNSEEDWNGMLLFSRYIVSAIADNRQSEEEDSSDVVIDLDGELWCQVCQVQIDSRENHVHRFTPNEAGDFVDTLPEF